MYIGVIVTVDGIATHVILGSVDLCGWDNFGTPASEKQKCPGPVKMSCFYSLLLCNSLVFGLVNPMGLLTGTKK
jgi:hypothetical protein